MLNFRVIHTLEAVTLDKLNHQDMLHSDANEQAGSML